MTGNESPRDYNESSDVEPEPERDDVTGEVLYEDEEGDLQAKEDEDKDVTTVTTTGEQK